MKQFARFGAVLALLASSSCSDGRGTLADVVGDAADRSDIVQNTGDTSLDAPRDSGSSDTGDFDATNMYRPDAAPGCDGTSASACTPMPSGCAATEICDDGLDNNCDLRVDEGCPCLPGTVQSCFAGPPGSRHIGACSDGTQRCEGAGEFGLWGACTGGISPGGETCDMLDNDCNGCVDESLCCNGGLSCPGPNDPRVPTGRPFEPLTIDGTSIFSGAATSWSWTIQGGPCEAILPNPTFTAGSLTAPQLQFTPALSGDYTVTMRVTTADGTMLTCTFVVHIAGEGLRVELCWRPTTSTAGTSDLDLYLHEPDTTTPWFNSRSQVTQSGVTLINSCNWADCAPSLRGLPRVNWGYAPGPLARCSGGPGGATWTQMGSCPNPRIDLDGHGSSAEPRHGYIENINADQPRDGQHFRIMVHDCAGPSTHPLVNVYCGGFLRGTVGAAPDTVTLPGGGGCSAADTTWRVADVMVHVDAAGTTTGCDVTPLRATAGGADLRVGDINY